MNHTVSAGEAMDWFSWLSKSRLDPTLIYDYGLALTRNELEQDDIAYFTHEFLQSMGIHIAKHRLEILKLAKKDNRNLQKTPPLSTKFLIAINRTKERFAKYITTLSRCEDPSLAIVPRPRSSYGSRLRGSTGKRNQKMVVSKHGSRLLLTNGRGLEESTPRLHSFSSPMVYDLGEEEKVGLDEDGYWCNGVEETIQWDCMFQDLKPT